MSRRAIALGCAAALSVGAAVITDAPVEARWWQRWSTASVSDAIANEADGSVDFDITLDRESTRDVYALYLTRSGTARAGQDFDRKIGVARIPAGETSATATVQLIDDEVEEGEEVFSLRLLAVFGARRGDGTGVATIADDDGPLTINVLHINDHHSHLAVEDDDVDLGTSGGEFDFEFGGFPRVTAKIAELEANLDNTVKVHAGDAITGTLFFSLFKGEADAALMNTVCFDMFALGNHEFDESDQGLVDFLNFLDADPSVCDTPVIAANVVPQVGTPLAPVAPDDFIQPYVIEEFEGQQVGFVGIDIAQKTQVSSSPLETTQFLDEVATAQANVDELASMGVENVVLVTHQGYQNDLDLAAQVTGVDAIIGGDSHTLLGDFGPFATGDGDYPTVVQNADGDAVCVVQAWQYSYVVGELNLTFDDGRVTECGGTPHYLIGEPFTRGDTEIAEPELSEIRAVIDGIPTVSNIEVDPEAAAVLAGFSEQVTVLEQQVVGEALEPLCLGRIPGDTRGAPLCTPDQVADSGARSDVNGGFIQQIVTDAFESRSFRSDFALQNAGGVRINIPEGDITIADVFTLLPFANTLVELELTGAEVELVLEQAMDNFRDNGGSSGSYPYASKLRYDVDLSAASGSRVSDVEVKQDDGTWTPIVSGQTYVVATNSFIASGRDGYLAFGVAFDEGRVVDTFTDYAQGFIDYLEEQPDTDGDGVPELVVPAPEDFSTQTFVPGP